MQIKYHYFNHLICEKLGHEKFLQLTLALFPGLQTHALTLSWPFHRWILGSPLLPNPGPLTGPEVSTDPNRSGHVQVSTVRALHGVGTQQLAFTGTQLRWSLDHLWFCRRTSIFLPFLSARPLSREESRKVVHSNQINTYVLGSHIFKNIQNKMGKAELVSFSSLRDFNKYSVSHYNE